MFYINLAQKEWITVYCKNCVVELFSTQPHRQKHLHSTYLQHVIPTEYAGTSIHA